MKNSKNLNCYGSKMVRSRNESPNTLDTHLDFFSLQVRAKHPIKIFGFKEIIFSLQKKFFFFF